MRSFRNLALLGASLLALATAAPVTQEKRANIVPGKYIVTLKSGLSTRDLESHLGWVDDVHKRSLGKRDGISNGIEKKFNIDSDFSGYAGTFDEETIAQIKEDPNASTSFTPWHGGSVIWTLWYTEDGTSENEAYLAKKALTTQSSATWGLGAISHKSGSGSTYMYESSAGSGTYGYIVDTGVLITHNEFGGRASKGYNAVNAAFEDTVGHGTHVAGTVAGSTYGVSKSANIIAVKVFDGDSGYTSDILDGFSWAVNDIVSNGRTAKAAINMSLGGSYSSAVNSAVETAYQKGVVSAVAAGNSAANAANYSPASAANALTVGAVDSSLSEAYYSNYGSVLDLYAPGSSVKSAWIGSNSATNTISGTSMASPHVCGVVLYLQSVNSAGSASSVSSMVKSVANTGLLSGLGSGSPNRLAYNGNGN
ncbi:hypothetical protein MKZ38_006179 [Zalerion maritima]|uniref:Uncharacterized protein n=1 Tax=Zalerion maritima TaxID=339359 RepID=A0AAD5WPT6_9PEZI|nr:hypothetical protein MKZ38_006179 [Zalerion maritima]